MNPSGLVVEHLPFCGKDHRFDPIERSKNFQGLISRLKTSWVDDYVKRRCRLK